MRPLRTARIGALAGTLIIALGMAGASPLSVIAATALPNHVYSPYFETWTSDSIATIASQSGAKYLTLAFLETLSVLEIDSHERTDGHIVAVNEPEAQCRRAQRHQP